MADMTKEGAFPYQAIPLGRGGTDEEMAGTLLYMASEAGAYNAGYIHMVDGGRISVQPGATY
jgi:NAD(P)-dependent dehydrogenase (short-subunit alcohol dehydrogenase family)